MHARRQWIQDESRLLTTHDCYSVAGFVFCGLLEGMAYLVNDDGPPDVHNCHVVVGHRGHEAVAPLVGLDAQGGPGVGEGDVAHRNVRHAATRAVGAQAADAGGKDGGGGGRGGREVGGGLGDK